MSKKYQVFISSTYTDLVEERKAVEETIIRAGDIPVGMEAFPAADDEQFEFIKTIIDQCDYYVLIIAGRYGSVADDGLSYTEKEYHYAVEQGIPVLVMLHGNRGSLPQENCERDSEGRELLEAFVATVSTGRLRKEWTTTDGLKLAVRESLDHAKATKQRPGWVRGDQLASSETLERLLSLQEENERLKRELREAKPKVSLPKNLAGLDVELEITGRNSGTSRATFSYSTTYGEVFELLAPHLMMPKADSDANSLIARTICERKRGVLKSAYNYRLDDEIFQTLKIQLNALGVVETKRSKTTAGGSALFWYLTALGEKEMISRRVVTIDEDG